MCIHVHKCFSIFIYIFYCHDETHWQWSYIYIHTRAQSKQKHTEKIDTQIPLNNDNNNHHSHNDTNEKSRKLCFMWFILSISYSNNEKKKFSSKNALWFLFSYLFYFFSIPHFRRIHTYILILMCLECNDNNIYEKSL